MELGPGPEHRSQGVASSEGSAAQVDAACVSAAAGTSLPRFAAAAGESGGPGLIAASRSRSGATGATGAADRGTASCCRSGQGDDAGSSQPGSCSHWDPSGACKAAASKEGSTSSGAGQESCAQAAEDTAAAAASAGTAAGCGSAEPSTGTGCSPAGDSVRACGREEDLSFGSTEAPAAAWHASRDPASQPVCSSSHHGSANMGKANRG